MADDEDGLLNISLPGKIQLGVIGTSTLLFLFAYLGSAALNGFQYVNQWTLQNIPIVLAFWGIIIGIIPIIRPIVETLIQVMREEGPVSRTLIDKLQSWAYSYIGMGGFFVPIWIYYQFNPPTTGLERIVAELSKYVFIYVIFSAVLSASIYGVNINQEN